MMSRLLMLAKIPFVALALIGATVAAADAQQKVTIGLPVTNYGPLVPVYAARDLGFFAKNDVAVEITAFRGSSAAQEALAAGAVDIIDTSPVGAARAIKKGIKEKIVGMSTKSPTGWHIMVLTDSPIKSVKDLEGKSVAITSAGGLTEYYLLWAARQAGVTNVNRVPVGAGGLVPSLKAGQVDASVMHSPLPYELILNNSGRSIFDIGKQLEGTIPDVWVARQDLIDSNPKATEGVLRSIYQAAAYMKLKQNRAESLALLKKYTGETDDKIVEVEQDVVLEGVATSARIEPKWLDLSFDLAKLAGVADLPPVSDVYTDKFAGVSAQ